MHHSKILRNFQSRRKNKNFKWQFWRRHAKNNPCQSGKQDNSQNVRPRSDARSRPLRKLRCKFQLPRSRQPQLKTLALFASFLFLRSLRTLCVGATRNSKIPRRILWQNLIYIFRKFLPPHYNPDMLSKYIPDFLKFTSFDKYFMIWNLLFSSIIVTIVVSLLSFRTKNTLYFSLFCINQTQNLPSNPKYGSFSSFVTKKFWLY